MTERQHASEKATIEANIFSPYMMIESSDHLVRRIIVKALHLGGSEKLVQRRAGILARRQVLDFLSPFGSHRSSRS